MRPFGALAALVLTVALVGCGEVQWTRFDSASGRCSVEMPGTPEATSQPLDSALGRLVMNKLELPAAKSADGAETYAVIWVDYPTEFVEKPALDRFLDGVRDGNVQSAPGRLVSEKVVDVEGHPARDIVVALTEGRGSYRNRFLMVGNRLYQITVTRDRGPATEAQAAKFIESFRLSPRAAAPER